MYGHCVQLLANFYALQVATFGKIPYWLTIVPNCALKYINNVWICNIDWQLELKNLKSNVLIGCFLEAT